MNINRSCWRRFRCLHRSEHVVRARPRPLWWFFERWAVWIPRPQIEHLVGFLLGFLFAIAVTIAFLS
jgi:hypothetical protein